MNIPILPLSKAADSAPPRPAAPEQLVEKLLVRADEHFGLGSLRAARDFLSLAAELRPDQVQILEALGSLQYQLGDLEDARDTFSRAAAQQPDHAGLQTKLAAVCLPLGQDRSFEAAVQRALTLAPHNPDALRLLANHRLQHDRHLEAAKICFELLQHQPEDVEGLLIMGKCLFTLGDLETARVTYQEILRFAPANPLAQEALEIIAGRLNAAQPKPELACA